MLILATVNNKINNFATVNNQINKSLIKNIVRFSAVLRLSTLFTTKNLRMTVIPLLVYSFRPCDHAKLMAAK